MKGLEFFKSKTNINIKNYKDIESAIDQELPYLYRLFISTYEMGLYNIITPRYIHPKFNDNSDCGFILFRPFENEEYGFDGFLNEKELINDWNSYSKISEEYTKYDLLRIATLGIGGGIFIGMKNEKKDKIYLVNWDNNEKYQLIAENIFEFSKTLFFKEDDDLYLNEGFNYSQLYKEWGDDLWKIKE